MLDFMDHVQHAFYEASHWNLDNSYGTLNATARGMSRLKCMSSVSMYLSDPGHQHCSNSRRPKV